MNITTYSNFTKRPNSTKQPSSGTSRTVTLKQATSIESPTFILADSVDNLDSISAVLWDGRYYFVDDIQSTHNNITEISCSIDRGATFKSAITSSTQFIERCAVGYDPDLTDPSCSDTYRSFIQSAASGNMLPSLSTQGYVCLTIASTQPSLITGGGTDAVFMNITGVRSILAKLWTGTVVDNLKNVLGDAWSAIISATYIPCLSTSDLPASFTSGDLRLGDTDYSDVTVLRCPYDRIPAYTYSYEFDIDTIKKYNAFGWRNAAPHSQWKMFLPFYGIVDIPIEEYLYHPAGAFLVMKVALDYVTGKMVYTRYKRVYVSGVATDYPMARYNTNIGISIPLSNIKRGDFMEGIMNVGSSLASAATGDFGGGAASLLKGITNLYQNTVSSIGNLTDGIGTAYADGGSSAPKIRLYQIGHESNVAPDTYASTIGLPFMAQDLISNHTGFVKCNNASVEIAGTAADKDAVNAMLNNGIFIE